MDIFNPNNQLEFFNSFAEKYDKADRFTLGLGKKINRNVIGRSDIPSGKTVCDLMCGDGKNIPFILDKLKCKKVYAVDFSEAMINKAKRKYADSKIIFLNENSLHLSIPDSTVDAVTCTFGIKTLKLSDQELLLKEINRILKPGGIFVIAEISKPIKKIPLAFSYLFFNGLLEMESFVFNYKFIRRKFLWRYIDAFGSAKMMGEYAVTIFSNAEFFSWYGGIITGISGRKN